MQSLERIANEMIPHEGKICLRATAQEDIVPKISNVQSILASERKNLNVHDYRHVAIDLRILLKFSELINYLCETSAKALQWQK